MRIKQDTAGGQYGTLARRRGLNIAAVLTAGLKAGKGPLFRSIVAQHLSGGIVGQAQVTFSERRGGRPPLRGWDRRPCCSLSRRTAGRAARAARPPASPRAAKMGSGARRGHTWQNAPLSSRSIKQARGCAARLHRQSVSASAAKVACAGCAQQVALTIASHHPCLERVSSSWNRGGISKGCEA